MNPEKQRIAIAKACGWRKVQHHKYRTDYDGKNLWFTALGGSPAGEALTYHEEIPYYLNSLNAMHEAEEYAAEHSDGTFANGYPRILESVVAGVANPADYNPPTNEPDRFDYIHANATQRAEAFLKTLNLWEEE